MYWPTLTKDTIQRFPFHTIIEHTAKIINQNKGIILSILKVFAMFELRLFDDRDKVEVIAIRCINWKKITVLYLVNSTLEEMITKFVLNAILHYVGMSWIVFSIKETRYDMDETNHTDWLNEDPWYNKAVC